MTAAGEPSARQSTKTRAKKELKEVKAPRGALRGPVVHSPAVQTLCSKKCTVKYEFGARQQIAGANRAIWGRRFAE
jgi:hypothetical protein